MSAAAATPAPAASSGSISIPSSSRTWVGGSGIATLTTTPQIGRIGHQAPEGSMSVGLAGPAATTTSRAAIVVPSSSTTPCVSPPTHHGRAPWPTRIVAPRAVAQAA